MVIVKTGLADVIYSDTAPEGVYDYPAGSLLLTPSARYFCGEDGVFREIVEQEEPEPPEPPDPPEPPEPETGTLGRSKLGAFVLS